MTKEEFRTIRKSLGLSQEALGKKIFKKTNTVYKYESGMIKITGLVEKEMLRLKSAQK